MSGVRTGLDRLPDGEPNELRGRRPGRLTNTGAVDRTVRPSAEAVADPSAFLPPREDREDREIRHPAFDLLAGDGRLRTDLAHGRPVPEILEQWERGRAGWSERVAEVSLYRS